jgi:nitrogen fixation protein FixH
MAKQEYIFSGKAAWVGTKGTDFNDGKGPVWSLAFYPRTAADRKEVQATGIKNKPMIDDGKGIEEGLIFFRLRNNQGPYSIIDSKGEPLTVPVGNGSEVMLKLLVETFNSEKHGPQARSWVTEVMVTDLIPYVKEEAAKTETKADLPV